MKQYTALTVAALTLVACAAPVATTATLAPNVPAPALVASGGTCVKLQRGVAGHVADTRVAEAFPNENYGAEPVAFAGRVGKGAREMLLKFELDTLPKGARITKATITLHRTSTGKSKVGVYRAVSDWTEAEATWDSMGSAYQSEPVATLTNTTDENLDYGPVSFDATELARAWQSGHNHGLVLAQTDANTSFATSEASCLEERPRLDLCFE